MTTKPPNPSVSPILIGQCGGAWSLHGSIKIISWSTPKNNIFTYQPWYLGHHQSDVRVENLIAYQISHPQIHRSGRSLAVNFVGINGVDDVLPLQGQYIYILNSQLKHAKDEYYWHDLIGMSVVNTQQHTLGEVVEIIETGVHDVLKVCHCENNPQRHDKKIYYLIPFVRKRYIVAVDREQKIIRVDWDKDWSC